MEECKKFNYDYFDFFDIDFLIEQFKSLKEGNIIYYLVYLFVEYIRLYEIVEVKLIKVIIVEGILIFENKEFCDLMDIKVFVDIDGDVRIIRRLLRDV